jgi:hypothetical protein
MIPNVNINIDKNIIKSNANNIVVNNQEEIVNNYNNSFEQIQKALNIDNNKNLIYNNFILNNNNINININNNNNNNVNISKNILFENTPKNRNIVPIINKINKIGKNAGESQIMLNNNIDNNQNTLFSQKKNQKKNSDFNISMRTKSLKNEKKIYFRPINVYTDSVRISYRDMNSNIEEEDKNIHLNLVNYYCCGSICRKKKHIELFDIGVSLYRRRMDIINVFTILLLTEKTLLKNEKQKKITINKDNYEITPILNNIK